MKKLIATAAALALAGAGLAACDNKKNVDTEPATAMMTSEMMAPSSDAMMTSEMSH